MVELWNYLGALETPAKTNALLARVWHLHGESVHFMWRSAATYPLSSFHLDDLEAVRQWLDGKWRTHTLVLSGDGGLGKTRLAEALLNEVSPSGYWWAWGYAKGLRGQLHSRMLAMSCVPNIEVHGGVLESIVVCPWFLDNADDFREIDGLLQKGQGFLIDEITLKKVHV